MAILFFNEDTKFRLKNKRALKKWIKLSIQKEDKTTGQINYIFTSDKYLLSINQKYLSHNYFTDIVTFNFCTEKIISGDIYISLQTVKNNSCLFNVTYEDELYRVMIHGVLHLIGYNDSNNAEKLIMREKEDYYLAILKNLS
jgi:probable rRNA maturation factor